MTKFDTDKKSLYIDGKRVLRGWESLPGWYWFATEKAGEQMSDLGDGKPGKDTIYFGLAGASMRNGATSHRLRSRA